MCRKARHLPPVRPRTKFFSFETGPPPDPDYPSKNSQCHVHVVSLTEFEPSRLEIDPLSYSTYTNPLILRQGTEQL